MHYPRNDHMHIRDKLEQAIDECEEKQAELERRLHICTSETGRFQIQESIARQRGMIFAYNYVITDMLPTE